ncbi:biliverdin-producing heme oxygenase [Erythrobacter sp. JK5]|uniref:biliverdin-producing heme oxygenase n=1 Tax=Erythrobacter sp. JK5 TaxID=2829500 RepID=UPI001BA7AD5D|nr:biliverdin-producing heme oxygenase [Erythrobacter sp. JK5]QUL36834.1 biliverdin-producing heme oxygenase [Erythrobacter sp. JK5]
METIGIPASTDNLRAHLRAETAGAHDILDRSMRSLGGWTSRTDYAAFLALQYAGRAPVEAWLSDHAPSRLQPPPQCSLIVRDLAALGAPQPAAGLPFAPAAQRHSEAGAIGAAWVLAGSALGNRTILKELDRSGRLKGSAGWPHGFLGDQTMLAFWQGLRRDLERPASPSDVESASSAAKAVFDHFIRCAQPVGEAVREGARA